MNTIDIIIKKRDKLPLNENEIKHIITGAVNGSIPDYQLSSFLMAAFINGLNEEETFFLTKSMLYSGEIIDFKDIEKTTVDKHSTGGVADTTTLILSPAVSSLGASVMKMSGRGLGFSGGTADKLSAIPGFDTEIDVDKAKEYIKNIDIALVSQSSNLAPADKILYALRDVTGTVESIPLIASSIVSKKIATGADAIVFDVKCGNGAFMKDVESARELSKMLISLCTKFGKKSASVISSMNQPLGNFIGNSLEVIEAIETLKGKTENDLYHLSSMLGAAMLYCIEKASSLEEGKKQFDEVISNGKALEKLSALIKNQNGNAEIINDYSLLPSSKYSTVFYSTESGYLSHYDTDKIGMASVETGAGRKEKSDIIDLGAGIIIHKRIGDYVEKGDKLFDVYSSDKNKLENAVSILSASFKLSDTKPPEDKLILDIILP